MGGSEPVRNRPLQCFSLERAEWVAAILLSSVVLFLLIVRAMHAGGLWRDECDAVQLAQMPRLADLLAHFHYSSFPLLFSLILRSYTTLFGDSDIALRCFGFTVGAAFIAAAWFLSFSESRQPPLVLLALIGLNSNFLGAGMWVRGYGIGSVLIVLAFTLTANLLRETTARRLAVMGLISIAAAQCLFFNGPLLPAIFLGALVVLLLHRRFKSALLLSGIGLLIVFGYVPYSYRALVFLHIAPGHSRWATSIFGQTLSFSWDELMRSFGTPSFVTAWVWIALILGAVAGATYRLRLIWNKEPATERDTLLFGLIVLASSIPLFWGFMQWLGNPLARYYLVIFCLLAAAADLVLASLCRFRWLRLVRISVVLIGTITMPFAVWPELVKRETNIDILANKLEKEAGPTDLILVNPWSRGISFNRYYHGPTTWMTVPNIQDHRMHRYDLLPAKMSESFPLEDIETAISGTLKSGNRVWVVNDLNVRLESDRILVLAPAPDPKFGWTASAYSYAWTQQLVLFLQRHVTKMEVPVPLQSFHSWNEDASLILAEGWQY